MKLHELEYTKGSRKPRKRIGRGNGSGYGNTAGRGENGQKSRSGGNVRPGFEGGQNPLYLRLPKRGFSNTFFKKEYTEITLDDLNRFNDGDVVTVEQLKEKQIIKQVKHGVKVLANGKLEKKLTLKLDRYTKTAREAIISSGGSIEEK